MRKIVSGMLFALLFLGMATLAFNARLVRAQNETIVINSDGSVTPSSAPISTVDNITYTFTGGINNPPFNGIVVERNNIVINGAGYTVQGAIPYQTENGNGIELANVNNVTIKNVNIENCTNGIYLSGSTNDTITACNSTANTNAGIYLYNSSNNTVSGNVATENSPPPIIMIPFENTFSSDVSPLGEGGICLYNSSNNVVRGNNATANGYVGVYLEQSSNNNTVNGNNVAANDMGGGVEIDSSSDNALTDNTIENNEYNIEVFGTALSDFMNSIDTSNLVNGKPAYYITNQSNSAISNKESIGYLAIVNSLNITVQGLTLSNNFQGIMLAFTNDSRITNNNVTQNYNGIYLYSSSNNIVNGNDATSNVNDGIFLYTSSNNTIVSNAAKSNSYGFELDSSSNNVVSENIVSGNAPRETGPILTIFPYGGGVTLSTSANNTISGNYITSNSFYGISLDSSSNNTIYHNVFENTVQTSIYSSSVYNAWDNGYPSGGNYWSDYKGNDSYSGPYQNVTGSDGIGDTPYVIDSTNTDHYPLMGTFSDFNVANGEDVQVVSNSTVFDFQFNGTAVLFNVSGANGTTGFCTVYVPLTLFNGTFTVLVNGTQVQYRLLPSSNGIHNYLYFTYSHSTEQVIVEPEFPNFLILATFLLAMLLTSAIYKKKHRTS